MFTGIIECLGTLKQKQYRNNNIVLSVESPIGHLLQVDQSVAHNGICLSVTRIVSKTHTVEAVAETIKRTSIDQWNKGELINLERALVAGGRLDGHMVQGHIDCTGTCVHIHKEEGSHVVTFECELPITYELIEKGSIAVNGVSLTCFDIKKNQFSVALIPFTLTHTQFDTLQVGDIVNIEFDLIGKYIKKIAQSYFSHLPST